MAFGLHLQGRKYRNTGDDAGGGDAGAGAGETSIAGGDGDDAGDGGDGGDGSGGESADADTSIAGGSDGDDDSGGQGEGDGEGDGDGGEGSDGDGDGDKDEGAPEGGYSDFEIPEGTVINEEFLGRFTEIAAAGDLSQERAQELVTLAGEMVLAAVQESNEALEAAFQAQRAAWVKEIKADPVLGGDNLAETTRVVRAGTKFFGGAELDAFRAMLNTTGYGNHPLIVAGLHRVGKLVSQDRIHTGGDEGGQRDAAEALYPNQGKD